MWRRKLEFALCAFIAFLTACGAPGVPVPPSLEVAHPVTDLRATRKGDNVYLTWTMPMRTTDRQNLRRGGAIAVCRVVGEAVKDCGRPIARLPFEPSARNVPPHSQTYTDHIQAAQAPPTSNFEYAISVLNRYGRSAGLSNQVAISAAPTLSAPSDFRAQLNSDGVHLSWNAVDAPEISGLRFVYRIYRRDPATNRDTIAGELPLRGDPSPALIDHSFDWEKSYEYRATVVTIVTAPNRPEQQVEGDDTPPVRVVTHDVFPPATPSGLQAVFSGPGQQPFIDLVWAPNIEADLAGYNVYRHEAGGAASKLNPDLIKSPAYRDNNVLPGHEYFYSVSAIDVRGNESPRSEEASENVPEQ
jgi:hypothetical protein